MGRLLRKGVIFTFLFAGVVAPAAADPIILFLIGIARDMAVKHAVSKLHEQITRPRPPDLSRVYPGTSVEPEHLRRLIDESFLYLNDSQRGEVFNALHEELLKPRNAAVRLPMIEYFADRARTVRAAQLKLSQLSQRDKERVAADFKAELAALTADDQAELGDLLRSGLLPVPTDLNQLLLAAFEAR
jgi:hypothetical protein